MNLSSIQRLVNQGDLSIDAFRYLLDCRGECEWLDYKELLQLDIDEHLCGFTKDILAIKNAGGGYIIIGVQDKTWQPVGLKNKLPYDSKMLRDKIRKGSGVELDVDIVHHNISVSASELLFALILVRSSKKKRKRLSPTIVAKDYSIKTPYGLRRGEIYFRKGDSTVKVSSAAELETLLEDLDAQTDQDAMAASVEISPFAIHDGTYRLLEQGYDRFIGRNTLRQDIQRAVVQDPRIWIINVHGPGGVGKSALVNWVVNEFYQRREFEAILQLTGKETILTPTGIIKASRSLYSLENLLEQILDLVQEESLNDIEKDKALAVEILSAWSTLLILDNLETVTDNRILNFIQNLPPESKAKVLITSRQKTGGWELPIAVNELNEEEVQEFLTIKSEDLGISCPTDKITLRDVLKASGGLPLAIQWIIGSCKILGSIVPAIKAVEKRDSPVLEFSFGNIWKILPPDAKAILAVMSIFDEPPTISQITVATAFDVEKTEKALEQLMEVTLVSKNISPTDGRHRYVALPITLAFARHKFEEMGEFETQAHKRHNKFREQMELQESELYKFHNIFSRYGLETDNEKRAAILCQRGQSELFIGNIENADRLFDDARDLAPQCSYIYALSSSYEISRNRRGQAKVFAEEACSRATRKTGALCFTIMANLCKVAGDNFGRVEALKKAIEYGPTDFVLKHQYGVALSKIGKPGDAILQFDEIIDIQKKIIPPQAQLLIALKTRMINLRRLGRDAELVVDLATVDGLLNEYPYLSDQSVHFREFRNENEA